MGINFKQVGNDTQTTDFAPLPEDRYTVKISDAVVGKTKNDHDMITVTFDITEGKYVNRKLWSNFTLTDKAYIYMYALLKSIGSNLIENEDVEPDDIKNALIGGKCTVYATIENSGVTNKPRNTVGNFKPLGEAEEVSSGKANLFK